MDDDLKRIAFRLSERLNSTKAIVNFIAEELGWAEKMEGRYRNFYRPRKSADGLSLNDLLRKGGIVRPKPGGGLIGYRSDIRNFLGMGELPPRSSGGVAE